MSGVDEQIAKLRKHVGASNDAELARHINVDKSTVYSWRNRGRVLAKYLNLLSGGVGDQFTTAPAHWGPFEFQILEFALFRFSAVMELDSQSADFRDILVQYNRVGSRWWLLMSDCQKELVEIASGSEGRLPLNALAIAIHSYRESYQERSRLDRRLILGR